MRTTAFYIFTATAWLLITACHRTTSEKNNSSNIVAADTVHHNVTKIVHQSILDDYIMEGYDTTEFEVVFDQEGIEILTREIGYQHGHTLLAMVMNLYKKEKRIFTDTIPFYPDPSEYELQYLEDGTPLLKISGAWANMGASSFQEDFYTIENDSIFSLDAVSGYCAGDHYNFDSDSTCVTELTDAHEFHYSLSRKRGQQYILVEKRGMEMGAEDPCKTGFDTLLILERAVMNRDTMIVYYAEEIQHRKKKILFSLPKEKSIKKLFSPGK